MSYIDLRKPQDKGKKVAKTDADIIVILSVERPTRPICECISDNFILLEGNKTLARCFISFDELRDILRKICEDNWDNFQVDLINALYRKFLAEVHVENFDYIDLYNVKSILSICCIIYTMLNVIDYGNGVRISLTLHHRMLVNMNTYVCTKDQQKK